MKTIYISLFISLALFACENASGQNFRNKDILSDSTAFAEFIYTNTHYPLIDFVKNVEGTAIYQFDTDSVGRINEIRLVNSSGSSTLDGEAERLIYEIPMQKRSYHTTHKISINFKLDDNKIFQIGEVEEPPKFHGGDKELMNFINRNFNYPPEAVDICVTGRIICGFVVEKDGTITIIEILRSLYDKFDAEAIRVIGRMPKWEAGKKDGKHVRVYFILPVSIH
ncbi:MAG: energy transducer TonB [Dysgonamonadaceae bacterium]|jgi:outer membrane biosynthesis protein TonB|nr:energy transducer TonB [Dysgonamonadaceae bacterium]